MKFKNRLEQYIDNHTENGSKEPNDYWYDDEFYLIEGSEILESFNEQEWLFINSIWESKSNHWIICLIDVLSENGSQNSIELLLKIANSNSEEIIFHSFDALSDHPDKINKTFYPEIKSKVMSIIQGRISNA